MNIGKAPHVTVINDWLQAQLLKQTWHAVFIIHSNNCTIVQHDIPFGAVAAARQSAHIRSITLVRLSIIVRFEAIATGACVCQSAP